jgi:hypothetical protein
MLMIGHRCNVKLYYYFIIIIIIIIIIYFVFVCSVLALQLKTVLLDAHQLLMLTEGL